MASPRGSWWHRVLGAVTGVGGLFWGRDLPYWGGGEEERARGEGASPYVIFLEAQVSRGVCRHKTGICVMLMR